MLLYKASYGSINNIVATLYFSRYVNTNRKGELCVKQYFVDLHVHIGRSSDGHIIKREPQITLRLRILHMKQELERV